MSINKASLRNFKALNQCLMLTLDVLEKNLFIANYAQLDYHQRLCSIFL